jgi:hypothetical protein
MPETMTLQKTVTVDETSYVQRITATGKVLTRITPSVPAAKVGSLTVRTDNDTGTVTMATGHGFSTSEKIDLFWSGGSRRNMTATVTGDSVVLDGGSGDDLPLAATAVTAMKPTEVTLVVTGDNVAGVSVSSPKAGYVVFVDDAPADISDATYKLADGEGKGWVSGDGTNPLAGDAVTKVKFSHGDSAAARTMTAAIVRD